MRRREVIVALGAVTAVPVSGRAGESVPVIGYLSAASAQGHAPHTAAFKHALVDNGLVEGKGFAIEYRWAEGHYDKLPTLARELVESNNEERRGA
jgi:putative tryptophan/tyrosine transport system substrate-binding protein